MVKVFFIFVLVVCNLKGFTQDYQEKLPGEWSKWITVFEDTIQGSHHKVQISFNIANCGQSSYTNYNNGESYYRLKSDFKIPKSVFVFSFTYEQCDHLEAKEDVMVDLHKPVFDDDKKHHFAGHSVKSVSLLGKVVIKQ